MEGIYKVKVKSLFNVGSSFSYQTGINGSLRLGPTYPLEIQNPKKKVCDQWWEMANDVMQNLLPFMLKKNSWNSKFLPCLIFESRPWQFIWASLLRKKIIMFSPPVYFAITSYKRKLHWILIEMLLTALVPWRSPLTPTYCILQ